jgi:hypothetical protein
VPRPALSLLTLLTLLVLTGCGAPYRANDLVAAGASPARVRQLGCLDVAFDVGKSSEVPDESLLLSVDVANHCGRPVAFDLRALAIFAADAGGRMLPVRFWDPRRELRAVHVDPLVHGHEWVRVDAPTAMPDHVCLDVRAVAPDAPDNAAAPLCFRPTAGAGFEPELWR